MHVATPFLFSWHINRRVSRHPSLYDVMYACVWANEKQGGDRGNLYVFPGDLSFPSVERTEMASVTNGITEAYILWKESGPL